MLGALNCQLWHRKASRAPFTGRKVPKPTEEHHIWQSAVRQVVSPDLFIRLPDKGMIQLSWGHFPTQDSYGSMLVPNHPVLWTRSCTNMFHRAHFNIKPSPFCTLTSSEGHMGWMPVPTVHLMICWRAVVQNFLCCKTTLGRAWLYVCDQWKNCKPL